MDLSIIILNYKSSGLVKQCLKNIENLNLALNYEVIVVDNNSADDLEKVLTESFKEQLASGKFKFVKEVKNRGMGAGNNAGAKKASGRYLLIVNPDVVILKEAIEKMIAFVKEKDNKVIVSPQNLNPDKTKMETCCRWPRFDYFLYRRTVFSRTFFGKKQLDHYLYRDLDLSKPLTIDWFFCNCFLLPKEIFLKIGGFDERFFLFLEDTDLCRQVWHKGYEVWFNPQAKVVHYHHRLSAGAGNFSDIFKKNTWIHIFSWLKYFKKWFLIKK